MHKRMKLRAVVFIRRAAFVMALCMMIGSLRIPVFAEEKNDDLQNSSENVDSDTLTKSEQEEEPEKEGSEEVTGNDTEEKELEKGESEEIPGKEEEGDEAVAGNNIGEQKPEESLAGDQTEEDKKSIGQETVSGNDMKGNDTEEIKEEEEEEKGDEKPEAPEIPEIIDVVVPTAYTLALNPYQLPVKIGENVVSTEQIISGMYGIVNKSSRDQIVTVSFTVEDRTEGELLFVDSAEEAQNAGKNVYAVYLAAVPANEELVLLDGQPIDSNVVGESLQNVRMTGSQEQAVPLYAGINHIAFRLSGAIYGPESEEEPKIVLKDLAPDGKGVTAYTFYGIMNPDAEWEKLSGGIRLSVVYTYQEADGSEEIIDGTGAMIYID